MIKKLVRLFVVVVVVVLGFSAAPPLAASERYERERDVPRIIAKLIAKFQKLFGVSTLDDFPGPPKP